MNYKELYKMLLENLCIKSKTEFDIIVEQPMPKFIDKLVPNKTAPYGCLFSKKLDEEIATEEDYKEFCEYIYAYIGMDLDSMLGKEKFGNFAKPTYNENK